MQGHLKGQTGPGRALSSWGSVCESRLLPSAPGPGPGLWGCRGAGVRRWRPVAGPAECSGNVWVLAALSLGRWTLVFLDVPQLHDAPPCSGSHVSDADVRCVQNGARGHDLLLGPRASMPGRVLWGHLEPRRLGPAHGAIGLLHAETEWDLVGVGPSRSAACHRSPEGHRPKDRAPGFLMLRWGPTRARLCRHLAGRPHPGAAGRRQLA